MLYLRVGRLTHYTKEQSIGIIAFNNFTPLMLPSTVTTV
jgi:hypothetical protein